MKDIRFITVANVLTLHEKLLNQFGGAHGVRDMGLLESALAQPQSSFGGIFLHKNIYEMAAAYAFHIIKDHAFIDGNKRTGLLCALVFLEMHGYVVDAQEELIYNLTISIANSGASKEEIASFFERYCQKIE